jgi:calcium permeable stress-gated cation channel
VLRPISALSEYLPMSLATKRMQARVERQLCRREGKTEHEEEEFDLFNRDCEYYCFDRLLAYSYWNISSDVRSMVRRRILNPTPKFKPRPSPPKPASHYLELPQEASGSGLHHSHSHSSVHEHRPSHTHGSHVSLHHSHSHSSVHGSHVSHSSRSPPSPRIPLHAPASSVVEESEEDSDWDFDDYGFDHPSSYADQPWIWIPKDELGLSEMLVAELREGGVDASDRGSFMDSYGHVEATRNPPDEALTGGHDA